VQLDGLVLEPRLIDPPKPRTASKWEPVLPRAADAGGTRSDADRSASALICRGSQLRHCAVRRKPAVSWRRADRCLLCGTRHAFRWLFFLTRVMVHGL
jgi:hypothetical protein